MNQPRHYHFWECMWGRGRLAPGVQLIAVKVSAESWTAAQPFRLRSKNEYNRERSMSLPDSCTWKQWHLFLAMQLGFRRFFFFLFVFISERGKREYVEGKGTAFYFGRLSEEEEAELFIQERKKGKRDDGCWFLDWCSCSGKKLREPGHREWSGLSRPPLLMDPASSVCPAASSFCCYGGYYYFWWHADRKSTCVTGESWARRRRLPNTLAAVHRREREREWMLYISLALVSISRGGHAALLG